MLTRAAAKRRMQQLRNNNTLKKIKLERKQNEKNYDKELLVKWLENLNSAKVDCEKIIVQSNTVKFVMFVCETLQLDDEVLFMSIDMVGKFRYCLQMKNTEIEEPILAIIVLVLISSKLVGQRQLLTLTTLYVFLQKLDINKYTPVVIEKSEREIMNIIKFALPVSSVLDDMNIMIEIFVKPSYFTIILRRQCVQVLRLLFINMSKICSILEACYEKYKRVHILNELRKNKLYFPSGVILCVVDMSEILKVQISYKDISKRISKYTNISLQNLDFITKTIHTLVFYKMTMVVK